jgi:hypothetical protein
MSTLENNRNTAETDRDMGCAAQSYCLTIPFVAFGVVIA